MIREIYECRVARPALISLSGKLIKAAGIRINARNRRIERISFWLCNTVNAAGDVYYVVRRVEDNSILLKAKVCNASEIPDEFTEKTLVRKLDLTYSFSPEFLVYVLYEGDGYVQIRCSENYSGDAFKTISSADPDKLNQWMHKLNDIQYKIVFREMFSE